MRLERITIINIRKHIGRLGLLTLVLTVVVATVATLYILARLMNDDLEKKLDLYGTNMVIVPKSDDLPLSYDGVPLGNVNLAKRNLTERDIAELKTIKSNENLAVIAPKLIEIAKLDGEDAIVVGVDFPKELKIKRWWRLRAGKKPKKGSNQALVGAAAAARHRLQVGQTIKIKGQKFKVAGILKSAGSQEDEPVYIDLERAQKIFGLPAQFSIIEVSAWCYNCPINVIVGQASEKLPHA
ncbi:MAG: ABC transporter permease, partial [Actinomycetia bacterium]|nr:ABC transporter permease [Actinomycetes bacterium]